MTVCSFLTLWLAMSIPLALFTGAFIRAGRGPELEGEEL